MATGDLTTLSHVKDWLGIPSDNTTADALLSRLISSASKAILNQINRSGLAAMQFNDRYDGFGSNFMLLRQWPVIAVQSIQFCGQSIVTPSTGNPSSNGFLLEDSDSFAGGQQQLTLIGYWFPPGRMNIQVAYTAGYQQTETDTVPAMMPYNISTQNTWMSDGGVTLSGVALTKVASNPGITEYSVSAAGVYSFNAALASAQVAITYSYVPQDLEQACWELVSERYKYKDRIGLNSKTLGGQETMVFDTKAFTSYVMELIQPYTRVVPT